MSKIISILLVIVILAAAGALLYPTVGDQYNQFQNARRILAYNRTAEALAPADNRAMLEAARAYNQTFVGRAIHDAFTEAGGDDPETAESREYLSLLNLNGDGIMGVIEIPRIGARLPIYHTTEDYGLERGVGHMEGTSLPVGGPGTHCGLAGHRALPSARLFTDLDQMEMGDFFYISVLGELLVYQVDQILVVLPHELEPLAVAEGEDYVTLVTCTPYGLNTHRLLVRGTRVAMEDISGLLAMSDGVENLDEIRSALICAVPAAAAGILLMLLIRPRRRYRYKK